MRTLDIFVSTLVEKSGGKLPDNFVVTLPKITIPEQVSALDDFFESLEKQTRSGAPVHSRLEMMIETTQSIINDRGEINLPLLLAAAQRSLCRGPLWHLRLHRELQHHRRLSAHDASGL